MATKAQREEIAAKTDLVRRLTVSGDKVAADALSRETTDLIHQTRPVRDHDGYLTLLRRAASAQGGSLVSLDELDDTERHAVEELQQVAVQRIREGVDQGLKLGDYARQVAEILLNTRLHMRNRAGLPDLLGSSKLTKNLAHDMYASAAADVAEDDVDRIDAHRSVAKAVRNRMPDVLVKYLRALDTSEGEVSTYFPRARAAYPHLSPTESVYALYESEGFSLPRRGRTEAQNELNRQRARAALDPGDDAVAALSRVAASVSTVVARAAKMSKRDRAELRTQLETTIAKLATEVAKL